MERERGREPMIAANSEFPEKPSIGSAVLAPFSPIFPGAPVCAYLCICVRAPQFADGEKTVKFHTQTRLLWPLNTDAQAHSHSGTSAALSAFRLCRALYRPALCHCRVIRFEFSPFSDAFFGHFA